MTMYHINKNGVPSVCKAKPGNCPYGGEGGSENHFDNIEEAQKFIDNKHEKEFNLLPVDKLNLSPSASQKLKPQITVLKGKIDPDKFVIPEGNMGNNKPNTGGIWTSTVDDSGESEWTKWTRKSMFYRRQKGRVTWDVAEMNISPEANILTIDNAEDYEKIINKYKESDDKYGDEIRFLVTSTGPEDLLDFDKLKEDYDGVRVTNNGLKENEEAFRHWSCESTLWFNLDNFEDIEYKEKAYKEKNISAF